MCSVFPNSACRTAFSWIWFIAWIFWDFDITTNIWKRLEYRVKWALLVVQMGKNLPARQETWVPSLSQEDPLKKWAATHCGTLAWSVPRTEEPAGLQSKLSQSPRHNGEADTQTQSGMGEGTRDCQCNVVTFFFCLTCCSSYWQSSARKGHLVSIMVWTRQAASAQFWPASFEVLSFSSLLRKKKKRKRKRKRAYLDASGGSDPTTGITLDPLSLTQLCIFQTCSSLTKTPHSPCFPLASPFLGFFCGFSSSPQPPLFLWGVCLRIQSSDSVSYLHT